VGRQKAKPTSRELIGEHIIANAHYRQCAHLTSYKFNTPELLRSNGPMGRLTANVTKQRWLEGCKPRSAECTLPCSYKLKCDPSPQRGHRQIEEGRLSSEVTLARVVINDAGLSGRSATNGGVKKTTVELVNLCSRMMDLLDAPRDISFLSKLIQREIIYRLLQGSQGPRLRAIAMFETKCHQTAKAVAWLRSNYEKPLRVEHLATIAGMSRSTLHLHFRALLRSRSATKARAKFNREYRRFFGRPPIRDIKALRDGKVVAITTA
jgi:AraC-like DNA-binding protein